jgi:hypothetical protein
MEKKYIVRLTDEERPECLKGRQKHFGIEPKRATRTKFDAIGCRWTRLDRQECHRDFTNAQPIEILRQRLVERGFR